MLHRNLANGLELAIKESHFARMVAIQCWVGTGSMHEDERQYGMAHVLEHMLFKGTDSRKVGEISSLIERYGGDINAYTTFDHTVFYLTLSSKYWREGVEVLADAVFNSAFDAEELGREKEVILEEIRQGQDNPSNLLGRKVFEEIFKGSPAARPIIGYEEGVAKFTRDDLLRYFKTWYHPNNMKVIITGDVDTQEAYQVVQEHFGQASGSAPSNTLPSSSHKPSGIPVHLITGDYTQARLEIAFPGPAQESPDQVDLDVAAFALGAGDSSRLNRKLRDEMGLSSSVGCSLYSPKFGGVFGVSAIPEPDKILACVSALAEQLGRLKHVEPVSEQELSRAVTNLRADQLYQEETVNGQARSLGFSLNTKHKTQYDAVYEAKVLHATAESVRNALDRWLDERRATIVAVMPQGIEVSEEDLRQAFSQGFQLGAQVPKGAQPAIPSPAISRMEQLPRVHQILPGLKLVYRQKEEPALFNLVAVSEGGLRGDGETPGLQNCWANLLTCATDKMSYDEIIDEVEGRGAILAGFSGKDSIGIKMQCFSEHAHHMARLWRDCLMRPVFPERQWEITKLEIQDDMRGELDSPASIAIRKFQEEVFGPHPYRYPMYGNWDLIKDFNPDELTKSFIQYRDKGPWVIGAVGSMPEQDVVDMIKDLFKEAKFAPEKRVFTGQRPEALKSSHIQIEQDKEQTHIVYGGQGLSWEDQDRYALDVLSTILGGSGGRLFLKLRDQEGLAYTVSPMQVYGRDPGAFGAYMACSPHKVEQALASLKRELKLLSDEGVSQDELERAINYLVGSHESEMQRGDSQALTMALMEAYSLGFDDFLSYSDQVSQVRADDIIKLSKRLFDPDHLLTVTVGR